ncbi:general stress protein [Planococcus salinus]|uniref:General stress protein 17M-like domain-containing protein n=1 Tax=Planococcus salinus TaxID=1848460 RepID=A0A3M8P923_9BACL|nr:general stress protein [Planococcus salinus]RNF40158.1 hypothetical protein EEX84_05835 [Planococcus salinus]
MANHKFIETYDSETEVLRGIEELKTKGYTEDDLFVVARDQGEISMVRGRTNVKSKVAGEGKLENFLGFLTGNGPVKKAFAEMKLEEQEIEQYLQAVKSGKIVLIADREYGTSHVSKGFNSTAAYGDPKDQTDYAAATGPGVDRRNAGTEDAESEEEEATLSTGPSSRQGLMPNDELTDTANTGRNRRGVPMMDRTVDNVPANDPNVPDMGAPENQTDNVREVDAHTIDIGNSQDALSDMPTSDPTKTDIPSAEEKMPDVPTGSQGVDRSLDTDAPGDLSQTARDRTRERESDNRENGENETSPSDSRK